MLPDDATPQVDCLIALALAEHPGYGRTEQAEFYEAAHMELAPLARQVSRVCLLHQHSDVAAWSYEWAELAHLPQGAIINRYRSAA